ncbi:serine/threonine-protein phosphatase 6 regulatory ankyrin repeat subunit B-like [Neltuma alba]|uniref:serine/threonine-protein phosphatase 6 regulatory ankyrin repeat subunit B-like n=1 Tax=Neltuma alba TaxID=207710 RepID=UPI0010A397D8|nr:serine/threonine-protein phosphatase 6 regulatory ankyrin repeat subunit B-like [Prosopis alba]
MKQTSHSSLQETELMNIETAHHHEEDRMRVLYEASYKGCVSTLNSLLQEDPGILQKISSQAIFIETPLHISASHGHLEFTKTLLSHKPELALERNSLQGTPLHLASAEGHMNIVKQLLKYGEEASFVRDQEGRIPLHYAVIRGRREVVLELSRAKPESARLHDDNGENIFHLCVMYNHLEILKDLMALHIHDTNKLLIERDSDGKNTILHLAIMLKQVKTVSYLLSIPKIRSEALNLKNDMGCTAPGIVYGFPKDSKSLEIQYNGDWVEDMRGNLSLVATVISTITFQAALNPPGSVIQQDIRPSDHDFNLTTSYNTSISDGPLGCLPYKDGYGVKHPYGPCPGQAMFAYRNPDSFGEFLTYNTISFVASLCVALLLVSGVPLKHRFVLWLLSIGMGIALTCLLNAYFIGLDLISQDSVQTGKGVMIATTIFIGLYALVGVYIAVKFVIWAVKKLKDKITKAKK